MESFGFHAIVVDGHDVEEVAKAFDEVKPKFPSRPWKSW
jgi:transketolase N-terminal domain/subunit